MSKKFQRTIEDFACGHCKTVVAGDGYTNHCPECLYSRHVDINPGDRDADCGGLMKPVSIEPKKGDFVIVHECVECGHIRKNKTSSKDNIKTVMRVSQSVGHSKF